MYLIAGCSASNWQTPRKTPTRKCLNHRVIGAGNDLQD